MTEPSSSRVSCQKTTVKDMEKKFLEIFKVILATRYPDMAFAFEEPSSFRTVIEQVIESQNFLVVNGQRISQKPQKVTYDFEFRVIGDIDECWVRTEGPVNKTEVACTVGYKLIQEIEGDGKKTLMDFCEVIISPEEAIATIDDLYHQIRNQ